MMPLAWIRPKLHNDALREVEERITVETGSEEQSRKVLTKFVVIPTLVLAGIVVGLFVFDKIAKTEWINATNKGAWDVLEVLLVPVAVGWATVFFTAEQNRRQRNDESAKQELQRQAEDAQRYRELKVEEQRAQDEALQAYLDQIGQLLLDEKRPLLVSERDESEKDAVVRTLARARTLTLLARIDGDRKSSVVQFLYESQLIVRHGEYLRYPGIVDLSGADLSEADLAWTKIGRIGRADLHHTNLKEAKLARAFLVSASLASADLSGATLEGAHLGSTDLYGANLVGASLAGAILEDTDLRVADLSDAVLRDAIRWTPEQLAKAKSLKGATMPNGQMYEDWLQTREGQDWLRTYKKDLGKEKHEEGVYEAWLETPEGKMWLRAIGEDEEISGSS
jgi:hypothetical protein